MIQRTIFHHKRHPGGRPSKLKMKYGDKVFDVVFNMTLMGATDMDLARIFEVGINSIDRWKRKYPEFRVAIKKGKDDADAQVTKSLFKRAMGYTVPDTYVKIIKGKRGRYQKVVIPIMKHVAPDTTAMIFWLKNRQRSKWCDVNRTELTGANGSPINVNQHPDLSNMSDAELAVLESAGIKYKQATKGEQN
jgi:hypothetical protein